MIIFILVNIAFGLIGLFVSYKIKTNKSLKKKGEKMVCLVGHKCDDVVFSDYSKFLGINLEIMGFAYYTLIALFYLVYLLIPSLISEVLMFSALGLTFGGFLFSIYLTYIQVFKLKSFCSWCLSSAASSSIIFFSSYAMVLSTKPQLIIFISEIQDFIKAFEFIALIVSIGIATVLEITTFKFLKDFKISLKESLILERISQFGWFTFFLFVLNNIGVYLPEKYLPGVSNTTNDTIFIIEFVFILLIAINGMINQMNVIPEIQKRSLQTNIIPVVHISKLRVIATMQSIVSLFLWYGLFYLNFMV